MFFDHLDNKRLNKIELECCRYLASWPNGDAPKTVREWAERFGWYAFTDNDSNFDVAAIQAINEFKRLSGWATFILKNNCK